MTGDQPTWHKSSYSGTQTNCVEVASSTGVAGIRDSKNVDGGEIRVSRTAWRAFIQGMRSLDA